jgi:hypothetical protein
MWTSEALQSTACPRGLPTLALSLHASLRLCLWAPNHGRDFYQQCRGHKHPYHTASNARANQRSATGA